ncbi:MAG: glycosyltransferase family 25 protein [Tabrizicola sp.]|jgi:glycosyl transferase family 25|nr:glycosyltransferase family 25 protein [Tabrizicola sp.]
MKAFCINLDRRQDRRDRMWSEFQRLGVEVERVAAVDGSLPDFTAITASLKPGASGLRLGPGAYACFQSHRLCWQKLLESGDPHAMVLEDDLIIAEDFARFLTDGWVPTDADVVKLETREVRVQLDRRIVPLNRGRYLAQLRSSHFGTGCYVISAVAAERLHRQTETVLDAIDEVIFDARSPVFRMTRIYQMVPAPVIQGDQRPGSSVSAAWAATSINNRFGPGETAGSDELSLPGRILRRLKAEARAALHGTRYTFVGHG